MAYVDSRTCPANVRVVGARFWPSALHGPRFMRSDEFVLAIRSYLPNARDCRWHRVEMGKVLMAAVAPRFCVRRHRRAAGRFMGADVDGLGAGSGGCSDRVQL